ncbi:MAG: DUF402 domain-containing protein [Egibacteraceae bacterium]
MEIFSTKYDGSLHYRGQAALVAQDDGVLALYRTPGVRICSYRGGLETTENVLFVHWADRPFNLAVSWDASWKPRSHYVNVATPSTWHDGVLRFVDLDLDLIWRHGSTELFLDDEGEFEEHRVAYGYPAALVEEAWQAVAEVRELFATATPPFDGRLYDWRPGRPVSLGR